MSTPDSLDPENPVEPLLKKHERVTGEHIAKINAALEASGGSFKDAADILGLTREKVSHMVETIPPLTARWRSDGATRMGETKMNEATAVNRTPPKPLALSDKERYAISLATQEKKIGKSLRRLGFGPQEIEAISAVEEFAGQHFEETLSIMHGGLLKSAMRLMILAQRIESDYLQDDGLEERDRKWWWDTYFRILEKLRDMNEQTNKAALTKALIELKRKEAETGKSGGKAGFQPLSAIQVNVSGVKDVKITPSNVTQPGD